MTPRSRRAGQRWALRCAGVAVDESALPPLGPDADVPLAPEPLDVRMTANVAAVELGMEDGPDRPSPHRIAGALKAIGAHRYLIDASMNFGFRDSAILSGAHAAAHIERLAQHGSEDAAGGLLILHDLLEQHGIAREAFAAAREMLVEEQG